MMSCTCQSAILVLFTILIRIIMYCLVTSILELFGNEELRWRPLKSLESKFRDLLLNTLHTLESNKTKMCFCKHFRREISLNLSSF